MPPEVQSVSEDGSPRILMGTVQDITELKRAEEALQEARDELEQRVKERTSELAKANEDLKRAISRHERTEKALRESEEKYRLLLDNTGLSVVYHDLNGKLLMINNIGARNLGGDPEDFCGKTLHQLFDADTADIMVERARQIVQSAEGTEYEDLIQLPAGARWFWSLLRPVKDPSGASIGVQVTSHDITERKRMEEALKEARDQLEKKVEKRTEQLREKNEELEMFTYFISHDLQAPLRTIEGFSRTLVEDLGDRLEDERREELLALGRAAENMHELIEDMMTYARLGIQDFSKTEVSLKSVLNNSQFELIEDIKKRGADIRVLGPLPVVRGHERTLVRLMTNLISNAIKFVPPERRPEVCIGATRSGNRVRVSVQDNGIGIAPEYREKIFRMFERLHSRHEYPGTGVGLAIVKKAVELHGGKVGVESEHGKGSTFWFEIPD
ncbi:MAG: PAS domain S-box protein, partial [Candidatus Hydrogenedentota bacterium]